MKANFSHKNHSFVKCDIGDKNIIRKILNDFKPNAVINFASETHVDRSIHNPEIFKTNVLNTFNFVEQIRKFYQRKRQIILNLYISTDEVWIIKTQRKKFY